MSVTTTIQLGSKQGAEILFELCNQTKKAYKYAVRRVKRRQVYIANEMLGSSLCSANFIKFW